MQKPMNRTVEKVHMMQISTPLFSPAIAPEGAARSQRAWRPGGGLIRICFAIN